VTVPDGSSFGDAEPDDAFCVGDDEVDWSQVEALAVEFARVEAITDDRERLEAAIELTSRLTQGE